MQRSNGAKYTLGKKGCYTPGWCVFFVIISISSAREVYIKDRLFGVI